MTHIKPHTKLKRTQKLYHATMKNTQHRKFYMCVFACTTVGDVDGRIGTNTDLSIQIARQPEQAWNTLDCKGFQRWHQMFPEQTLCDLVGPHGGAVQKYCRFNHRLMLVIGPIERHSQYTIRLSQYIRRWGRRRVKQVCPTTALASAALAGMWLVSQRIAPPPRLRVYCCLNEISLVYPMLSKNQTHTTINHRQTLTDRGNQPVA